MSRERNTPFERSIAIAVSRTFNEFLRSDDNAMAKLRQLDGRVVAICIRDTDLVAYAAPCPDGIRVLPSFEEEGEVDVRVTGRIADFIAYARASKRGESIGAGRIEISGDLSTAQCVQGLLSELQIDWDEILSRYIGDVGAHQTGRLMRAANEWGATVAARFEADAAAYLQIEARVLPSRRDTERLERAVYILAADIDRFEARMQRFEQGRAKQ